MFIETVCMEFFGKRLREIRKKSGLSQDALAKELGISKGALCYYENGERTPDIVFLEKVSEYYQVRVEYLLGMSDSMDEKLAPITDITPLSERAAENLFDMDPDGTGKVLNFLLESEEFLEALKLIECEAHSSFNNLRNKHRLVEMGYSAFVLEQLLLNAINTVLNKRHKEIENKIYHTVFSDEELEEYYKWVIGEKNTTIIEKLKQLDEEKKLIIQKDKEDWEEWKETQEVREDAIRKLRDNSDNKEGD